MPDRNDPFARYSPPLLKAFRWYLHWYFWRHFCAVRLSRTGIPEAHAGRPVVLFTNHPSWWDPALFILVSTKLFPGRRGFGPMAEHALKQYRLFERFGVFGIEDGARGAARFLRVARNGLADPRSALWITAGGEFADVRTRPVPLRPGIAHLARHAPNAVFIPVALEYVFWNESRPEALMRFGPPVAVPAGDTGAALLHMTAALTETMDALGAEAATRDPSLFVTLLHGTAGVGAIYDTWRRTRAMARRERFDARHEPRPL